mgnify:CR=1 FL=1
MEWILGIQIKMIVSLSEWMDKKYQGNKFRSEETDDSEVNDGLRNVWLGRVMEQIIDVWYV